MQAPTSPPQHDIAGILSDARWLCYGFNPDQAILYFVQVDDDLLEQAVFVSPQWFSTRPAIGFPLAEIAAHTKDLPQAGPKGIILHTAFCCSTLFARCLQTPGHVRVLRELPLYSGLARAKSMLLAKQRGSAPWRQLLELSAELSHRSFPGESATLNKPGNVFLGAAGDFLACATDCRGVILHGNLPDFLVSCLKKIESGSRPWLEMLHSLQPDRDTIVRSGLDLARAHPAQFAAVIWHVQMQMIRTLSQQTCAPRLRHISAEAFLAHPRAAVAAARAWMTPDVDAPVPESVFERELHRNAKDPKNAFDSAQRKREAVLSKHQFEALIRDTLTWSEQVFGPWQRAYEMSITPLSVSGED